MMHKIKYQILVVVVTMLLPAGCSQNNQYPFQNPSLTLEQRVDDLVSRLTLEEKVSQMISEADAIERLGIPAYDWQNECLHGVGKLGDYKVTVYPQPIGMAATWDEESMMKMADYTATEGRAIYHDSSKKGITASYYGLTYWSPNINIFRDPRWGRGHETFGEDPYLTTVLGKAFVNGLQGDDPHYLKSSACAKHYAVHSGPETLRHEFNTEVSEYDLWDTYLPAFRDLITEAGVSGVMCAYNAYAGQPCCGNDRFMMDILRNQWKFNGYVTSDCGAIDDFYKYHQTHPDTLSSAVDAVLHGTDLDCVRDVVYKTLVQAVREGKIAESYIDESVKRLFTIRFRLGMFDPEELVPYAQTPLTVLECDLHKKHALKMAQQSIVLLKNENETLPLRKDLKKIAVIGPNADNEMCLLGNYHGYPSEIVTILDAIRKKVSPGTEVIYEKMTDYLKTDNFQPLNLHKQLSAGENKPGFKAEYYNNLNFEGTPVIQTVDTVYLNYKGITEITPEINSLAFSARFTTLFTPEETAELAIKIDTDKRFRLVIDGVTHINTFTQKAKTDEIYKAVFEKGKEYTIFLESIMQGRHGTLSFAMGKIIQPTLQQLAARVKDADVIIFAGGISPELEGEQNGVQCEGFLDGDRTTIALPTIQTAFMKELKKTGKPVVFVMMTGSAIAMEWESNNIPAILNAWYGGQSGGTAVADVLFGDYNPAGRLPVTFYCNDNDLPPFEDYCMEGRTYRYFRDKALYPFGYGLSYTTFAYNNIQAPETVATTELFTVTTEVTNTGNRAGEEVVQLYLTHSGKESYHPIRSLKGFRRIHLEPGETQTVSFTLSPKELSITDENGIPNVIPGNIKISIGGGQPIPIANHPTAYHEKTVTVTDPGYNKP